MHTETNMMKRLNWSGVRSVLRLKSTGKRFLDSSNKKSVFGGLIVTLNEKAACFLTTFF